jgi:alkaline phosphatase D
MNRLFICTLAALTACCCLAADKNADKKLAKYQRTQYKKKNRDQITKLAQGKHDDVIKYFEQYLGEHDKDLESRYALALAYAGKGKIDDAMKHVNAAVDGGLPAARFVAGPRNLAKPLVESAEFAEFIKNHDVSLVHGPMLGDISESSARIWVRTAKSTTVTAVVTQVTWAVEDALRFTAKSSAKTDHTAVIQVTGLKPGGLYQYYIEIDGKKVAKSDGSILTLGGVHGKKFSIAFGGGAGYTPWYERMWTTIQNHDLRAMLLLGDNVYIDTPEVPETQQYCYYRRQSQPEFREFMANIPVYAVWDDHDFGDNDCHGSPGIDDIPWKPAVLQEFRNNWPNPAFGGGDKAPGIWFDFHMDDVQFFMLDTRFYRTADKQMLGPVQLKWLKDGLKNSKATFKVICTSVPMMPGVKGKSKDTWDGYPDEREAIFDYIADEKIEGVFILAADRHRSDMWRIKRDKGYDLHEFMSSRLTNVHTHGLVKGAIYGYNEKCSFGLVHFDLSKDDPEVVWEIRNIDNQSMYRHTLKLSQMTF